MTNYFHKTGGVVAPNLPGTLYISSVGLETNPLERFRLRVKSAPFTANGSGFEVSCQSSTQISDITPPTFDYIFVDPPFGGNLMYSELNFQMETWLRLLTNNNQEAIVNKTQHKGSSEYLLLMESAFREFYRLLKAGRWMTVEFHNSQSTIWNSIQQAILGAGFVVADVSILEKTHKTFKQVNTTNAVKKDLAISAYKPSAEFERRFLAEGGSLQGAWDFIRQHLEQLPIPALEDGVMETLARASGLPAIRPHASLPHPTGSERAPLRLRILCWLNAALFGTRRHVLLPRHRLLNTISVAWERKRSSS